MDSHANPGALYLETGEIDKALEDYDLAAEHCPENPDCETRLISNSLASSTCVNLSCFPVFLMSANTNY